MIRTSITLKERQKEWVEKKAINLSKWVQNKLDEEIKKESISIEEIKRKAIPILKRYAVKQASLFGSAVRRDMKKDSDIDILIEMPKGRSILDLGALQQDLEKTLERKIDIVEYERIHPLLKKGILKEQVVII